MKLKVCGMKEADNIQGLADLEPNLMGFIFYKHSPRYVGDLDPEVLSQIPPSIKKVGVFVNETVDTINDIVSKYGLDYVQLHGDEDVAFVKRLHENGVNIIKVFRVQDQLPDMEAFEPYSAYFLFDTSSKEYGGSGQHFDWSILKSYDLQTPFLLSGGIRLEDVANIKSFELDQLAGIDVNSKFERSPGNKDLEKIEKLMQVL